MPTQTLVIIEAKNKKEKLEHILGNDYTVQASIGHIMDLDPKKLSVDIEDNFKPTYVVTKPDIVKELKKSHASADNTIIASDDDAEGAFIAYSIATVLNIKNPLRIIFHEITENAILKAIKEPKPINQFSVQSQQTRRILDRLIGYKISPLLWKIMNAGSLSAGRVQSPVVRLIAEKDQEIKDFFQNEKQSFFKVNALFENKYKALLYTTKISKIIEDEVNEDEDEENKKTSKLKLAKIVKQEETTDVLKQVGKSQFIVTDITEKISIRQPSAPFTTATCLQESVRKLGFTSSRTTSTLQHLYSSGHISYPRTDSCTLSNDMIKTIGQFIKKEYGDEYHRELQYKTKSKSAAEAHECIRPTNINIKSLHSSSDENRLYDLIWKRAVGSQMTPAKFKIHIVEIDISSLKDYKFVMEYEELIFDGFLKVYNIKSEDAEENQNTSKLDLPKKGSKLKLNNATGVQEYKRPPPRYDECSLINHLDKKLGIGRPSTYQSLIHTIQEAGYVTIQNIDGVEKNSTILQLDMNGKIKEDINIINLGKENKKFVVTELGNTIIKFLMEHFSEIMDYQFTANMEEKLDLIETQKVKMLDVLNDFYTAFKPLLDKLEKNIVVYRTAMKQTKELGVHPILNYKIYITTLKFGPIVQMINENNKIVNRAPIRKPLTVDTIKIEDAVELFKFPRELGKHERKMVYLCRGQYGYYLEHGHDKKNRISVKLENTEIDEFTLEKAIDLIKDKKSKILWEYKDVSGHYMVLNGPYGKYINVRKKPKEKGKNYKLPDSCEPTELTIEKVQEIIKNSYSGKRYGKKNIVVNKDVDKNEKTVAVNNSTKKLGKIKKITKKEKEVIEKTFDS